jgi:pilus assembly protein CpaB
MRYTGLVIAIALAAVAAIVVMRMSAPEPAPTGPVVQQVQPGKTIQVYVAAVPIAIGTAITQEMLALQPWPEHLAVSGFMRADNKEQNVVGMVARASYQQNEPLIQSKLANPNDPNFIASELPTGMRVLTIPVNETDGLAGFVFPGDHVDLIYTHEYETWVERPQSEGNASEAERQRTAATETLVTNVKVLAMDQRATGANAVDKNGNLIIPRSATLMLTQEDAQRVRLAQKTGTVSLVLRPLSDREAIDDPVILTSRGNISQASGVTGQGGDLGSQDGVKIVRGAPKKASETQSTDVPALRRAAPTPLQEEAR